MRPEKMEECTAIFEEIVGPPIAVRPGLRHGHWWVDRTSGEATSVTFWLSEADGQASWANIPRLIEGMSRVLASDEAYQETFRTVHHPYLSSSRRR